MVNALEERFLRPSEKSNETEAPCWVTLCSEIETAGHM